MTSAAGSIMKELDDEAALSIFGIGIDVMEYRFCGGVVIDSIRQVDDRISALAIGLGVSSEQLIDLGYVRAAKSALI